MNTDLQSVHLIPDRSSISHQYTLTVYSKNTISPVLLQRPENI